MKTIFPFDIRWFRRHLHLSKHSNQIQETGSPQLCHCIEYDHVRRRAIVAHNTFHPYSHNFASPYSRCMCSGTFPLYSDSPHYPHSLAANLSPLRKCRSKIVADHIAKCHASNCSVIPWRALVSLAYDLRIWCAVIEPHYGNFRVRIQWKTCTTVVPGRRLSVRPPKYHDNIQKSAGSRIWWDKHCCRIAWAQLSIKPIWRKNNEWNCKYIFVFVSECENVSVRVRLARLAVALYIQGQFESSFPQNPCYHNVGHDFQTRASTNKGITYIYKHMHADIRANVANIIECLQYKFS